MLGSDMSAQPGRATTITSASGADCLTAGPCLAFRLAALFRRELVPHGKAGTALTRLADVEDAVLDHLGGVVHVLQRAGVVGVVDAEDAARADCRVDVGRAAELQQRQPEPGQRSWQTHDRTRVCR